MSAIDFRRMADVGPRDDDGLRSGSWGVVVEDPTDAHPIQLELYGDGAGVSVALGYDEAGELFDTLAQAMGLVVAAHGSPAAGAAVAAIIGLEAAHQAPVDEPDDTPTDEGMPGAV